MLRRLQVVLTRLLALIGIHYILTSLHLGYADVTSQSISHLRERLSLNGTRPKSTNEATITRTVTLYRESASRPDTKANATLVMLARNEEMWGVISSIRMIEDRFNRKFHYPWVLLNDEPFTEEFESRVKILASNITFGLISPEMWKQPSHIDEERARASRERMKEKDVLYGESVSYRNMCRFFSGFFFRHELLKPYRYYWRVEPKVQYFCDVDYDPFVFMEENNKTYGFVITLEELPLTVPTLWDHVKQFQVDNPHHIANDNAQFFLQKDNSDKYNLCHFWSNFEIADMDFWRGPAYTAFFDALDTAGGFYYERWGDAPVHSIAAALLLPKSHIHFFSDIGYRHDGFQHCPQGEEHRRGRCSCDPRENFDYNGWLSCMNIWDATIKQ